MSRLEARQASREGESPTTAIVSITDCGSKLNTFYKAHWLKEVLHIQFDDVDFGGHNCITQFQATEIADFALGARKQVERFIVHCEFGQSRSAGVAAAISEYLEGSDGGIFYNRKYNPNRTCYKLVLSALKKRGKIPGFLR